MAGTYLFDTNIFVDVLRGNQSTINKVNTLADPAISAIVIGELYYGAHVSGDLENKVVKLEGLTADLRVLMVTKETAKIFGKIKNELRKAGKPIPENDIWIAASAIEPVRRL